MLPDFILIGAMKCGTTTLAAQLAAQAGLFMTAPKEPNFFSDDAVFAQGPDWYEQLFTEAPSGAVKGEASTHYTKLPTHPRTVERLAAAGVQSEVKPRFVYMIRDPVERAVSHYIHDWSREVMEVDIAQAFARHPELVDYGRYGYQIAPYLKTFGVGSVLLTSLEQMTRDPDAVLAEVCRFVGLPGVPAWDHGLGAQNVSAERFRRLPLHRLLVGNPVARALRRALVPKAVRDKVRRARSIDERPKLPDGLRRELACDFAEDRAVLSRQFPGHPALDLCYPFLRT